MSDAARDLDGQPRTNVKEQKEIQVHLVLVWTECGSGGRAVVLL